MFLSVQVLFIQITVFVKGNNPVKEAKCNKFFKEGKFIEEKIEGVPGVKDILRVINFNNCKKHFKSDCNNSLMKRSKKIN